MASTTKNPTPNGADPAARPRRGRVSQADVPSHTIEEALRVARAINDQYGGEPTPPLDVAAAMGMAPTTGKFRSLTGASLAYGFTEGGAQADIIGLTELGRRALVPTAEGDDLAAKREGLLRPRVVREFLEKYDTSPLPRADIGHNVLEQMRVPRTATERTMQLIVTGASELGLLRDINGKQYVNLHATRRTATAHQGLQEEPQVEQPATEMPPVQQTTESGGSRDEESPALPAPKENRRVFISHGSNQQIVGQLKELLSYGDFEPVVSVERETTSKPVPDKVMSDMRSCGAGIIHVGTERKITDEAGDEHHILNENVLIEIGAAMALYEGRFILLVEKGVTLPSNLQGLYEVRFAGQGLDHDATMKLLKAFNDFKG